LGFGAAFQGIGQIVGFFADLLIEFDQPLLPAFS
jgi:hypothetical protein